MGIFEFFKGKKNSISEKNNDLFGEPIKENNKSCKSCKSIKSINEFAKKGRGAKGQQLYRAICKDCRNLLQRKWRGDNPEKARAHDKKYRQSEKGKKTEKEYRERTYVKKERIKKRKKTFEFESKYKQLKLEHYFKSFPSHRKPSKPEIKIAKFLIENEIKFEGEFLIDTTSLMKKISSNYNGGKMEMRLDFYFPAKNLAIEYDGPHHSNKIVSDSIIIRDLKNQAYSAYKNGKIKKSVYQEWKDIGMLEEYLQEQWDFNQVIDKVKTNFCFENDIKLYRINYENDLLKELKLIFKIS
ncbi:hypothetical protein OAO79_01525 [Flavobacteriaceae bacterium]|nr:hypothetical protein [Flavobacteriaceae bacterium]